MIMQTANHQRQTIKYSSDHLMMIYCCHLFFYFYFSSYS